eukprot:RCo006602
MLQGEGPFQLYHPSHAVPILSDPNLPSNASSSSSSSRSEGRSCLGLPRAQELEVRLLHTHHPGWGSLRLRLVLSSEGTSHALCELQLYCPYWLLNLSCWAPEQLHIRHSGRVLPTPCCPGARPRGGDPAPPVTMFTPKAHLPAFAEGLTVAVEGSAPCGRIPVDTVDPHGGAVWMRSGDHRWGYGLGVSVSLAPAPFHRTKVVRLTDLFLAVNRTPEALVLRQRDGPPLCVVEGG